MAIWEYKDQSREAIIEVFYHLSCIYCNGEFDNIEQEASEDDYLGVFPSSKNINVCKVCGWWRVFQAFALVEEFDWHQSIGGAVGSLRELNLSDIAVPLDEVRAFLAAKYEARFSIHPRLFEETVASVFSDLGYAVDVTAYSNDGGIDVILTQNGTDFIGVQVKRYAEKIEAEQIRALTGALIINGFTKGVFVTTSRFSKGAYKTAGLAYQRGIPIELIDAPKFYEALGIAQRASHTGGIEYKPWSSAILKSISTYSTDPTYSTTDDANQE